MEMWAGAAAYGPILLVAVVVIGAALVVSFALARVWPLLVPAPIVLGALAWYGWEFSDEAVPYAVFVAVVGYAGLGVGLGLRRLARRLRA